MILNVCLRSVKVMKVQSAFERKRLEAINENIWNWSAGDC